MSREIRGLSAASACVRPKGMPAGRARKGAKAYGLRYERSFAKAASWALHGQWFEFQDANGSGHCQTDFLARFSDLAVILETKLSDVEQGRKQLRGLYEPVVEKALGLRSVGIVVVRHLTYLKDTRGTYRVHETLSGAITQALCDPARLPILHWRERGPLGLGSLAPQPPIPLGKALLAA